MEKLERNADFKASPRDDNDGPPKQVDPTDKVCSYELNLIDLISGRSLWCAEIVSVTLAPLAMQDVWVEGQENWNVPTAFPTTFKNPVALKIQLVKNQNSWLVPPGTTQPFNVTVAASWKNVSYPSGPLFWYKVTGSSGQPMSATVALDLSSLGSKQVTWYLGRTDGITPDAKTHALSPLYLPSGQSELTLSYGTVQNDASIKWYQTMNKAAG